MITTEEARRILENDMMSDQEVEATISGLQLLAELVFDHWTNERASEKTLKI